MTSQVLNVIDELSRESLTMVVVTSPTGRRVARELDDLIESRGKPKQIIIDNGTEFTSVAVLKWAETELVE